MYHKRNKIVAILLAPITISIFCIGWIMFVAGLKPQKIKQPKKEETKTWYIPFPTEKHGEK